MKEIAPHTTVHPQLHTPLEPVERKHTYREKSLQKREDALRYVESLVDDNDPQEKRFLQQLVQCTVKIVEIQWL